MMGMYRLVPFRIAQVCRLHTKERVTGDGRIAERGRARQGPPNYRRACSVKFWWYQTLAETCWAQLAQDASQWKISVAFCPAVRPTPQPAEPSTTTAKSRAMFLERQDCKDLAKHS